MLSQLNFFLQFVLNLTVYVACAGAFVFALMGMAGGKYAVLLELDDAVHSVVNLSPLATFLLGPCVFTATTWGMYRTMLRFTKAEVRLNFYVKATILLADALALTCWLLFLLFRPQMYKNGHVPALDALYRDYDRESLCWSGVSMGEYDANGINAERNCLFYHLSGALLETFTKKCVACRIDVRHNEPTVFTENQWTVTVAVFMIFVIQCWNAYVRHKDMRFQPKQDAQSVDGYDTTDEEEERQSKLRLLEIVSEGRQSATSSSCSPDSGATTFSFLDASEYDVPSNRPLYSIPNSLPVYKVPRPALKPRPCHIPVPPPLPAHFA
ncbi:actin rearrangement inducing factor-1 [Samia ricini nucleopolyhedrovirus]|nr:arif-1 [Philosamia cynthia ricini nucleopolyhedrovirus virus]BBD50589.1 actin rearrangement inducing factor-1 [Antheraea yamamai nucleopolyhedrovirus]BBD50741.1 actin rearrangement inducing factor-1 [Samia cynthia nucleopolyhedrovirus]BBD51196.1 actin rearrangement inducing factor-1 [Samia ricini nucleopolyhedrovirus]BBD51348.1 actin rearrangement inducing factor-1 [Samia ricini nucleopolyhedrovirus]